MPKKLTPQKIHKLDLVFGLSETTIKEELLFDDKYKEKNFVYDPDSKWAKQYPNTYFLCHDFFGEIQGRILPQIEKILERIIETDDSENQFNPESSIEKLVLRWYLGELDNHDNNALFLRNINEEAKNIKLSLKPFMNEEETKEFINKIGRLELFDEIEEIKKYGKSNQKPKYFKAVQATLAALGFDQDWIFGDLIDSLEKQFLV